MVDSKHNDQTSLSSDNRQALLDELLQRRLKSHPVRSLIPQDAARQLSPLSFAQQRLWFLYQLTPQSGLYNRPLALRLRGALDCAALEHSLQVILQRHAILRTVFKAQDGRPYQQILPMRDFSLPLEDLQALPVEARQSAALSAAMQIVTEPFSLQSLPLVRARLFRLAPNDHIFLFVTHHIAFDRWSESLFLSELGRFYTAAVRPEQGEHVPPLPIQYVDFAAWEQEQDIPQAFESALAFWRTELEGLPLLELPADRPRQAERGGRGGSYSFVLSSDLSQKIKHIARQENATLFMTLLAVFNVLLYRYTGQLDLAVGTPVARRNQVETEGVIGLFLNTVIFRTQLAHNDTFLSLLQRLRKKALETYQHQDLPFEVLVRELAPRRYAAQTPFIQVLFNLENVPEKPLQFSALQAEVLALAQSAAELDLSLEVQPQMNGSLACTLVYDCDIFDESTIQRMADHFTNLAESIAADPAGLLASLPMLGEQERRMLLIDWNATEQPYPAHRCVHQLFEEQVRKSPDAIVASSGAENINYAALNQRANQLAYSLINLGVKPETRVCIFLERSLDLLVAYLAVWKAGGGYIPLDPFFPEERIAYIVQDAQAMCILTQQHLLERLPPVDIPVLCLDQDWQTITAGQGTENPDVQVDPQNTAYVIYTSGSTGKPKGAITIHDGLTNLVCWYRDVFEVTAKDRGTQLAGLAFDSVLFELWPFLITGGSLYFPPDDTPRLMPEQIRDWILAAQITITYVTAPLAELALDLEWPKDSPLRIMQTGADRLHRFPPAGLGFAFVNNYGPTECSVVSTFCTLEPATASHSNPPIGRPISNYQVYILDSNMLPVPIGVPGELYIGGVGVGSGYLHKPALTAERFLPDPFSKFPGARMYRSGDKVRWLPDGQIDFLGRFDHQVKLRGFRIELGEIESVLGNYELVKSNIVILREDEPGNQRLVAYLVLQEGCSFDVGLIRAYLQKSLPGYMIPASFVVLDALPVTPNGKVDRARLPIPEATPSDPGREMQPPRDMLDRQLVRIFENLLGVKPIGIRDDFFDLGGHSLLAVQLFARIEKLTGQSLPLSSLYKAGTVAEIAELLRHKDDFSLWTSLVAVQPEGTRQPLFLLPAAASTSLAFKKMSRYLGKDQPLYSFDPSGLKPGETPHTCVEDMAAQYVDEMCRFQPEGPYLIGGICFGAHVALEMAHLLLEQGKEVALLIVLGAAAPASGPSWKFTPLKPKRKTLVDQFALVRKHLQERDLIKTVLHIGRWRFREIKRQAWGLIDNQGKIYLRLKQIHWQAQISYVARPFHGKILFIQSQDEAENTDYKGKWQELALDGMEYVDIRSTNHRSMLIHERGLKQSVEALRTSLESLNAKV